MLLPVIASEAKQTKFTVKVIQVDCRVSFGSSQ